jgi:UDP-N-acetylmuramoylalanine--D-glutamate ligase
MLTEQGYNCWLGGNIGTPLMSRIDEIKETDIVVLELSSFQLQTMKNRIHTAVVTNLSPNHLDVHNSMGEYEDAKKNILRYQTTEDIAILNFDNEITRKFSNDTKGKVVFFSRTQNLEDGVVFENGSVVLKTGRKEMNIVRADEIILPGVHNLENYMAAIAATAGYVSRDTVKKVASSFRGVAHRIEHVRDLKGVGFYNDSIGTSPTRTIASIRAFSREVILIAGGYDKHIPYDDLGSTLVERVKCLFLLGQTSALIEKALKDEIAKSGRGADIPVIKCETLEEAVNKAYNIAEKNDIVLLSPASASFDMYKNFEERGDAFKNAVNLLLE